MSAGKVSDLPQDGVEEVALVGRSNVGKSSLLNRITAQRKLARTSATPGRTQKINVFDVTLRRLKNDQSSFRLVDLPGFGYAKLSKKQREELQVLVERYLGERSNLKIVCLLNDVRRSPQEEEFSIRHCAWEHEKHLVLVLTKLDKLSKVERAKAAAARAKDYDLMPEDCVQTGEGLDVKPFWERMGLLLEG